MRKTEESMKKLIRMVRFAVIIYPQLTDSEITAYIKENFDVSCSYNTIQKYLGIPEIKRLRAKKPVETPVDMRLLLTLEYIIEKNHVISIRKLQELLKSEYSISVSFDAVSNILNNPRLVKKLQYARMILNTQKEHMQYRKGNKNGSIQKLLDSPLNKSLSKCNGKKKDYIENQDKPSPHEKTLYEVYYTTKENDDGSEWIDTDDYEKIRRTSVGDRLEDNEDNDITVYEMERSSICELIDEYERLTDMMHDTIIPQEYRSLREQRYTVLLDIAHAISVSIGELTQRYEGLHRANGSMIRQIALQNYRKLILLDDETIHSYFKTQRKKIYIIE